MGFKFFVSDAKAAYFLKHSYHLPKQIQLRHFCVRLYKSQITNAKLTAAQVFFVTISLPPSLGQAYSAKAKKAIAYHAIFSKSRRFLK